MKNKDLITITYVTICLILWGIGGALTDRILSISGVYDNTTGTLITLTIWTIFCIIVSFLGWLVLSKLNQFDQKFTETKFIKLKLEKSFKDWVKEYDMDIDSREKAGIRDIYRGVNKLDEKDVLIVLEADPSALANFLSEKEGELAYRGQLASSEDTSTYLS